MNKRIALRKLGRPEGADPNAVIFIMEHGSTLDGADLKLWVDKIADKVDYLDQKQHEFFQQWVMLLKVLRNKVTLYKTQILQLLI